MRKLSIDDLKTCGRLSLFVCFFPISFILALVLRDFGERWVAAFSETLEDYMEILGRDTEAK